jgi:hypothetical protein
MVIQFFDTYLHIYIYYWCFTDFKSHLKTIIAYYSNSVRNIQTIHICDINNKKTINNCYILLFIFNGYW